jgi:hypothetical protein
MNAIALPLYGSRGRGKQTLISPEDYDRVGHYHWRLSKAGYVYRRYTSGIRNHSIYLHQVILDAPSGFQRDHRDADRLNNTRENLRLATQQQNTANARKRKGCTSRFKGVSRLKGEWWQAGITFEGRSIYLGIFKDEIEAARAYDRAAREHFAEYARLNFPGDAA